MIQRRNGHIFSGKGKAGGVMTSDDDENSGRKTLGETMRIVGGRPWGKTELEEVSGWFTVYILLLINM